VATDPVPAEEAVFRPASRPAMASISSIPTRRRVLRLRTCSNTADLAHQTARTTCSASTRTGCSFAVTRHCAGMPTPWAATKVRCELDAGQAHVDVQRNLLARC
jgi:hypothetical protein